jgi:hypothetical protein
VWVVLSLGVALAVIITGGITGEAMLKIVGINIPIKTLEFSVNCQFFTSNTPLRSNYLHPPSNPTLAAPLSLAISV